MRHDLNLEKLSHFVDHQLQLIIVVPVYNEQQNLKQVVDEWIVVLRKILSHKFLIVFFNDGSTDGTMDELEFLSSQYPELQFVHKKNSGHGPTCLLSYHIVYQLFPQAWIFQMDSDGQCDPQFFAKMWESRERADFHQGYRVSRDDGFKRVVISVILKGVVYIATGIWVQDPNVPYRLMRVRALAKILPKIPSNFFLGNVLLSSCIISQSRVLWYPIHFRNRFSGESKVQGMKFAKIGWELFRGLVELNN